MISPNPVPTPVRSSVLAVIAVLLVAAAAVFGAAPAQAHSQLVSSTPADGEQVTAAPTEVVLTFNEALENIGNEVVVSGADGASVGTGTPTVDGEQLTQAVTIATAGQYTVTWRAVSGDGHPIDGTFTFDVPATALAPVSSEDSGSEGSGSEGSGSEGSSSEGSSSEGSSSDGSSAEPTTAEATTTAEEESPSGPDLAKPIVITLVAIAAIAGVVLVVRRNRAV